MRSLSQDTREIQQTLKEGAEYHMKATLSTSDPPSAPHITADYVEQEKNASRLAYDENIKKPAGNTFLPADLSKNEITEIIPGRAWVLSNVIDSDECEDWIARGEAAGIFAPPSKNTVRTASRTLHYYDSGMSSQVRAKLTTGFISNIEQSRPGSAFRGIHDNWKIVKYQPDQSFPAHYDQDSHQTLPPNKNGTKERETTSHTLLLYLTDDFDGGSTRFFPTGNFENAEDAIDVKLPKGSALIFEQYGLLHSGLEITSGVKIIAQTGLLRAQPDGLMKPSVFRWGPGIKPY